MSEPFELIDVFQSNSFNYLNYKATNYTPDGSEFMKYGTKYETDVVKYYEASRNVDPDIIVPEESEEFTQPKKYMKVVATWDNK